MPNVTLSLRVAKDDPTKDAIAFEGKGTKSVWDKTKGETIQIPKWNWVARSKIEKMEPNGSLTNVTLPKWVAKKNRLIE